MNAAEVIGERKVGTVTATVVRCFEGQIYSVTLRDRFGVTTWALLPHAPSEERVESMIDRHVHYSQARTKRN